MGKKKTEPKEQKPYIITDAVLAEGFCNYSFKVCEGHDAGDTHKVKGSGLVLEDMPKAFQKFNAHLACIDDVFEHSGTDVTSISKMHNHELTALYDVTGFKIKGSEENESIILMGTKEVQCSGGHIAIQTPAIPLDSLSSYPWWKELKDAADDARNEVAEYKQGKCEAVEEKTDPQQLTIAHGMEEEENDLDFKKAKK